LSQPGSCSVGDVGGDETAVGPSLLSPSRGHRTSPEAWQGTGRSRVGVASCYAGDADRAASASSGGGNLVLIESQLFVCRHDAHGWPRGGGGRRFFFCADLTKSQRQRTTDCYCSSPRAGRPGSAALPGFCGHFAVRESGTSRLRAPARDRLSAERCRAAGYQTGRHPVPKSRCMLCAPGRPLSPPAGPQARPHLNFKLDTPPELGNQSQDQNSRRKFDHDSW